MAIKASNFVPNFRNKFKTYTPVVNLLEDSTDSTAPVNQKGTGGQAHTLISSEGAVGASKSRLYTGDPATRKRWTWTAGQGPTTIFMKVVSVETTTDTDEKPAVLATYDAESTVIADANLAQTGGEGAVLVQNDYVEYADGWVREDFDTPLETLDFKTAYGAAVEFRLRGV